MKIWVYGNNNNKVPQNQSMWETILCYNYTFYVLLNKKCGANPGANSPDQDRFICMTKPISKTGTSQGENCLI